MKTVTLSLLGREYAIGCDEGEETRLLALAGELDEQLQGLKAAMPLANEGLLMVIQMLMQMDQVKDARADAEKLKKAAGKLLDSPEYRGQMSLDYQIGEAVELAAGRIENLVEKRKKG